jgi:hypothetical protein
MSLFNLDNEGDGGTGGSDTHCPPPTGWTQTSNQLQEQGQRRVQLEITKSKPMGGDDPGGTNIITQPQEGQEDKEDTNNPGPPPPPPLIRMGVARQQGPQSIDSGFQQFLTHLSVRLNYNVIIKRELIRQHEAAMDQSKKVPF